MVSLSFSAKNKHDIQKTPSAKALGGRQIYQTLSSPIATTCGQEAANKVYLKRLFVEMPRVNS